MACSGLEIVNLEVRAPTEVSSCGKLLSISERRRVEMWRGRRMGRIR